MTDQDLRKLRRVELLELLVELSEENEGLRMRNAMLSEQLENRELGLREAGSIAEAALHISGVFQAAQDAAELYLENVKRLSGGAEQAAEQLEATKQECEDRLADARLQAGEILSETARETNSAAEASSGGEAGAGS